MASLGEWQEVQCSGNPVGGVGREQRGKVSWAKGGAFIKQTSLPITSSGELCGDQSQPPEITHLAHRVPKAGILARKLRDGE